MRNVAVIDIGNEIARINLRLNKLEARYRCLLLLGAAGFFILAKRVKDLEESVIFLKNDKKLRDAKETMDNYFKKEKEKKE